MFFKIKNDVFNIAHVEAICISDDDHKCVEISTVCGASFEYDYESEKSALKVMQQLEQILALMTKTSIIRVIDPDQEQVNEQDIMDDSKLPTQLDFFVQSVKNQDRMQKESETARNTSHNQEVSKTSSVFESKSIWDMIDKKM